MCYSQIICSCIEGVTYFTVLEEKKQKTKVVNFVVKFVPTVIHVKQRVAESGEKPTTEDTERKPHDSH